MSQRMEVISFRVTLDEYVNIVEKARHEKLKLSDYVRNCVLNDVMPDVNVQNLSRLLSLGNFLKSQIERGEDTQEIDKTLISVQRLGDAIVKFLSKGVI